MKPTLICAIWIDWYAYHVARFRGLAEHPAMRGRVVGLEMVGGSGVHQGMVFRSSDRDGLAIETLLPDAGWSEVKQERVARLLWSRLDRIDPEVVLVPGYYTAPAIAAALWAKRRNRSAILMTETTRMDHPRAWWKEAAKGRMIRSMFDGAIAGGKPHIAYMKELGFAADRIGRFYDVVGNDEYRREAQRLRATGERRDPYFLYVGRLAPEKNLETLIGSFAELRRHGSRTKLVLVGDGPSRGPLEAQVREMGLRDHVQFAGLKSTAEIIPYYAFARAFVLPSSREPWGLVVNEAMASGLPVIVSNRCGCAEDLVRNGANGFVFDPDHETELTELLQQVDGWSAKARETAGRHSLDIISGYSPQHWADEVYRLACNFSRTNTAAA